MNPHEDTELSNAIRAQATRHQAPLALRDRIVAALDQADAAPITPPRARSFWTAWQQWLGMGVAFACGLIVSLTVPLFHTVLGEEDSVSQEVVAGHVRSMMVAHLSDVASSDQHTVKPWFSGKLDFSPPVHDLAKDGFPLTGGRLDYIGQRPVAALVYQHGQHTINVFVWPARGDSQRALKLLSRQGFNLADWSTSGMQYWAVSDVSAGELQTFAQLLLQQNAQ